MKDVAQDDLQKKLNLLKNEIREREEYLFSVEQSIAEATLNGNDRLHEIQYEVDKLLTKQNQLIEYNLTLETNKSTML